MGTQPLFGWYSTLLVTYINIYVNTRPFAYIQIQYVCEYLSFGDALKRMWAFGHPLVGTHTYIIVNEGTQPFVYTYIKHIWEFGISLLKTGLF